MMVVVADCRCLPCAVVALDQVKSSRMVVVSLSEPFVTGMSSANLRLEKFSSQSDTQTEIQL